MVLVFDCWSYDIKVGVYCYIRDQNVDQDNFLFSYLS